MDREYSLDVCGLEKETLPPVQSFYTRIFEMDVEHFMGGQRA